MKTKEMIKELEKMNLQAEICGDDLFVVHSERKHIARINLNTKFEINTSYWGFKNLLAEDEREKVYVLLTKLAETDPKDREEEKKYYLRHKWVGGDYTNYLNLAIDGGFEIESKIYNLKYQTKFTKKEINAFKKKYSTNLEDFEIVEVEDENN